MVEWLSVSLACLTLARMVSALAVYVQGRGLRLWASMYRLMLSTRLLRLGNAPRRMASRSRSPNQCSTWLNPGHVLKLGL